MIHRMSVCIYVIRNRPAASPRQSPSRRRREIGATKLEPFGGQTVLDPARLGTPSGAYDMLISAQWGSEGPMLVLNNVGEFQRLSGLRVDYWV